MTLISRISAENVFECLRLAVRGSVSEQQAAQSLLLQMEGAEGQIRALVSVLTEREMNEEARILAVICLKNAVDRCWRPRDGNKIFGEAEKQLLRNFVGNWFGEPSRRVATQLAVLISRVARADWPAAWPEALECVFTRIRSSNELERNNALYSLHCMLKELSARKLQADRQAFAQMSVMLFEQLSDMWQTMSAELLEAFSAVTPSTPAKHVSDLRRKMDQVMTMVKILNRLLLYGFSELVKFPRLGTFFEVYVQHMQHLMDFLRTQMPASSDPFSEDVEDDDDEVLESEAGPVGVVISSGRKLLTRMSTVPVQLQKEQPLAFRTWLLPFLHMYHRELVHEYSSGRPPLEGFCISAVLFMSRTVSCAIYNPQSPEVKAGRVITGLGDLTVNEGEVLEAREMLLQFFTHDLVYALLELLLHRLLRMTLRERDEWLSSPEEFAMDLERLQEGDSVRCSAESLFLGLVEQVPELVLPRVTELLMDGHVQLQIAQQQSLSEEVLMLDALYLCGGLASYTLQDHIDVNEWLKSVIGPVTEAVVRLSYRPPILQRRVVWLLQCYVHKLGGDVLGQVVHLMVILLQGSNSVTDVLVKIACVQAIQGLLLLENPYMITQAIMPVCEHLLQCLYELIATLDEMELRSQVMSLVKSIVEAMGSGVKPFAVALASPLPQLWTLSSSQNPLLGSLLATFASLINVCGRDSSNLHPQVLPALTEALRDPSETSYLIQDALGLWLAVMRNLPTYTPDVHHLFPALIPLLDQDLLPEVEAVRDALLLVEAYALVGGNTFLGPYAEQIRDLQVKLLGQVPLKAVQYCVRVLEALLFSCPSEACVFIVESGVFSQLLWIVFADTLGHQSEPDMALALYICVVVRVILTNSQYILTACNMIVETGAVQGEHNALALLLDLMFDKFDSVGFTAAGSYRRKLWAVGLLSLYPSQEPVLLDRLSLVLSTCDDVINEERTEEGQRRMAAMDRLLVRKNDDADMFYDEDDPSAAPPDEQSDLECIEELMGTLLMHDPVMQDDLLGSARAKLGALSSMLPSGQFEELMSSVSPSIMQTFSGT